MLWLHRMSRQQNAKSSIFFHSLRQRCAKFSYRYVIFITFRKKLIERNIENSMLAFQECEQLLCVANITLKIDLKWTDCTVTLFTSMQWSTLSVYLVCHLSIKANNRKQFPTKSALLNISSCAQRFCNRVFFLFDVKLSISIYISLKNMWMFAQQNSVRQW